MNVSRSLAAVAGVACFFFVGTSPAQVPAQEQDRTQRPAPVAPRLRLTLQDALDRARKNSIQLQSALTAAALGREDRTQARNPLLPSVTYNNSASYTQGIGGGRAGQQWNYARFRGEQRGSRVRQMFMKPSILWRFKITGGPTLPPQWRARRRTSRCAGG